MNKLLTLGLLGTMLIACRQEQEDQIPVVQSLPATTQEQQNQYDDAAIQDFLDTHYLNDQGKVMDITSTTPANVKKLSQLSPVKMPSGVVYIMRAEAQPVEGRSIAVSDKLTLMQNAFFMQARANANATPTFGNEFMAFNNGLLTNGSLTVDPAYYYVKKSILASDPTRTPAYYEIEGLGEALRQFKAFNKANDEIYNMQGVILIPSRAAFAKDEHFPYVGSTSLKDKTFMFNFQIYKAEARAANEIR